MRRRATKAPSTRDTGHRATVLPGLQQACRKPRAGSGHGWGIEACIQRLPARGDWVANVTWDSPLRRAASITLITDWWVALASALITTTVSRPPLAASAMAMARLSGLP